MTIAADDLSAPERRVWEAFRTGEWVDLRAGDDEADDPLGGADWGPERQVRAEVIAALLAGAVPVEPGSVGVIALQGARIDDWLNLSGLEAVCRLALMECSLNGGIQADEARLRTVSLQGSVVEGGVRLPNAHIDGTFVLYRAHLRSPDGRALDGSGLTVQRDVRAGELVAEGEVKLWDAHVGASFDLSGARLVNPGGDALMADGLTVGGSLLCRDGFISEGTIRLRGARLNRTFEMDGARLVNPGGHALSASRLRVAESVFFREGFTAEGEVRLLDGHFGGGFSLAGARLVNPGGEALSGDGLTVDQNMVMSGGFTAEGAVRLVEARIRAVEDDPYQWPDPLELDGLTYQSLAPDMPARWRLGWLSRSAGGYVAQPYEQLAAHYRRLGHDEQARRVLLAKQRARNRQQGWWLRPWGWLQDALCGYGYAPVRAAVWLVAMFAAGWSYFAGHHPSPGGDDHPPFSAALYVLDLILPAPDLGQEDAFNPLHAGLALAAGLRVFGWVLTIAVVASLTRALSRG